MRLVVVSRLAPNKRIDHAVEAVGILRDRGREVRLSIIGDGETKTALTEMIREKDLAQEVRFEGRLDERAKDELLASSHVLLHSSLREGWGLNVIEANCMGTPAVVYPVPGLIESTIHEETGLVANRESPEALADEVDRLFNDSQLYRNCRHAAWLRGSEFHWDRILPRACEWLEKQALRGRG
jgi:glycosyltransferase involved in cell wall biosynthesis